MSREVNILDFSLGNKINEGKTKAIYEFKDCCNSVALDAVAMVFKDDITAGDGAKHDIMENKALIDWQTNKDIYEYLNAQGIRTHYSYSPEEKISVVSKLDQKINLEVVTRRIATGSILKHTNYWEGFVFKKLLTQFFCKDDFLHDPLLEETFIKHIIQNKNCSLFTEMEEMNRLIFITLEEAFAVFKIQLIDFKLEYGIIDGKLTLIDEITGGSFRLWPYAGDSITYLTHYGEDALNQLNPKGRLDKDLYRKGEVSLDVVRSKFQDIADITAQFKNLNLNLTFIAE